MLISFTKLEQDLRKSKDRNEILGPFFYAENTRALQCSQIYIVYTEHSDIFLYAFTENRAERILLRSPDSPVAKA